jgi:hypothetical protein
VQPSTRLKVHRHAVALAGRGTTVLRLRPGGIERFATNHFHGTWHILSDPGSARLLGQLCWALSYQRQPGTIVVLHEPELVTNPFDADPSNTIVVSNSMLGPFNGAMATALRVKLRRPRTSDGTVVLQTPGLAAAIADPAAFSRLDEQAYWSSREQRSRTWIDRINGCLVFAAPPAVLRAWGMALCTIGEHFWDGSDYTELDWPASTGEVQVFPDFTERVRRAATVRARLYPGRGHHELEQMEREAIWLDTKELIEDTGTNDHELSD